MTGEERRSLHVGLDLGGLRHLTIGQLGIRFLFGAVISTVAAIAGLRFGPAVGGLFLSFPAILPASLTLIARKDGEHPAQVDAIGAIGGAIALGVFAAVTILLLPRAPLAVTLLAATMSWLLSATALYYSAAYLLAKMGRDTGAPDRDRSLQANRAH